MKPAKGWLVAFVIVVAVHVAALYWPRVELTGMPVDSDKFVHALLFAAPAFVGVVAWHSWWPALLLAAHAPISEYLQATLLPGRSGAVGDALVDLAGVVLGSLAAVAYLRRTGNAAGRTARS